MSGLPDLSHPLGCRFLKHGSEEKLHKNTYELIYHLLAFAVECVCVMYTQAVI